MAPLASLSVRPSKNVNVALRNNAAPINTRPMNPRPRHPRRRRNFVLLVFFAFGLLLLCGMGNLLGANDQTFVHKSRPSADAHIQNITAVIMNHARPRNIQESELLPSLLANPYITEVLLLHSNPSTAFAYDHPKARNLNASEENSRMGLSLRFWFAGHHASNDWVLIVDDDMVVPPSTLQAIMEEFSTNPHRIVGRFGRQLSWWRRTGPITNGYNTYNSKGPTEVVLTKVLMMERAICREFHAYSHLVDDLIKDTVPYWNGEDVFMSLVANHVYGHGDAYSAETRYKARQGTNNYAMPWLPVGDVEDRFKEHTQGQLDVSGNFKGFRQPWTWRAWDPSWRAGFFKAYNHLNYRGCFWKQAKQRLEEEEGQQP